MTPPKKYPQSATKILAYAITFVKMEKIGAKTEFSAYEKSASQRISESSHETPDDKILRMLRNEAKGQ
jgi:hypothetical protein